MLAVVRADDESLVPPQAAGLALSVARPLPTETASLGFGGNPVGGGDKTFPFCIFSALLCGGWYHYPRRELRAVETLDARRSRRLICRFYAAAMFALCGLNIPSAGTHATPAPNRAHNGTHAETGAFRAGPLSLPSERSARSQTSPGRVSERRTLPLLGLGWMYSRRTQKACGTAMRSCASLSRGVAAPLGCVIR